jgi:hypothetical protein
MMIAYVESVNSIDGFLVEARPELSVRCSRRGGWGVYLNPNTATAIELGAGDGVRVSFKLDSSSNASSVVSDPEGRNIRIGGGALVRSMSTAARFSVEFTPLESKQPVAANFDLGDFSTTVMPRLQQSCGTAR